MMDYEAMMDAVREEYEAWFAEVHAGDSEEEDPEEA